MGFILGLIAGMIIMCILKINKIKDYEIQIDELMDDNMELMSELNELKYGKNKHITMYEV